MAEEMRVGAQVTFDQAKAGFLDRKGVLDRVDAAKRRILPKAAAYVMTDARHSIKARQAISTPGDPPHSHVTYTSKEGRVRHLFTTTILFFVTGKDAIIGPTLLNGATDSRPATELLEKGGSATVRFFRRQRRNGESIWDFRQANYQPRPLMYPALVRTAPKFPELWRGSLKPT